MLQPVVAVDTDAGHCHPVTAASEAEERLLPLLPPSPGGERLYQLLIHSPGYNTCLAELRSGPLIKLQGKPGGGIFMFYSEKWALPHGPALDA